MKTEFYRRCRLPFLNWREVNRGAAATAAPFRVDLSRERGFMPEIVKDASHRTSNRNS